MGSASRPKRLRPAREPQHSLLILSIEMLKGLIL
jgi:hypothetical protein